MGAYLRLLRNRDFAVIWMGATASLFGDGLTWVSLVWLTYELGGSAADVGLLAACYTAPVIVGGLAAGILLDRFDRRRLLIVDNLIRGAAVLSVPIAASLGTLSIAHLYVVAAVFGLFYMISLAGFPSMLPDLVDADDLTTANAMETISFGIGGVVGPAVAGILIAQIGAANNLALDALTYGLFVVCLATVRMLPAVRTAAGPIASTSGLRPAFDFVLSTPAILAITVMFMAFNVGEGVLLVLLPAYARDVLGAGPEAYGVLVSAFTAGVLIGSVVIGAVRWPWPLGRSIAAAQLAAGAVAVGLIGRPSLPVAVLILALVGLFASPLTIWAQTIRMGLIPEALRGRVFSLLRTLMQSTPPAGGVLAGAVLAAGGLVPAIVAISVVMGAPGAIGLFHRSLSRSATSPAVTASTGQV